MTRCPLWRCGMAVRLSCAPSPARCSGHDSCGGDLQDRLHVRVSVVTRRSLAANSLSEARNERFITDKEPGHVSQVHSGSIVAAAVHRTLECCPCGSAGDGPGMVAEPADILRAKPYLHHATGGRTRAGRPATGRQSNHLPLPRWAAIPIGMHHAAMRRAGTPQPLLAFGVDHLRKEYHP